MVSGRTFIISATVRTDSQEDVIRAGELFHRVCMGLALDGFTVQQDVTSYEAEDDDDDETTGEDSGSDEKGCDPPAQA
jgi:hypothetical protein